MASFVVFLVALPLCMGIAVASGVPPALGLVTGIVGGLVVGALAGSPLQVSGPAAGLTVLVYQIIQEQGIEKLGVVVLLAGVMQMVFGALRMGQWFRAISPAVIQGLLAGIGVLIIAGQIHVAVGDTPRGSGLENLLTIPSAIVKGVMPSDDTAHHLAAIVGVTALLVMIAWNWAPKKLKIVPAPLAAVIVASVVAFVFGFQIPMVQVPTNLLDVVSVPSSSAFGSMITGPVIGAAFAVALIASAETLLSATAVDRMHTGPRTQYNRELFAHGVGNSICGLVGALPMTGVIVRSTANVTAGAKTRLSAIMHGGWLLAFVVMLPFVLDLIPMAALAAILVYTGFKLLAPAAVRQIAEFGKAEVAIYFATIVAIVATNLLEGVLIGLGLSLLKLIWKFTQLEITRVENEADGGVLLSLKGAATFVRLPKLAVALDAIEPGSNVRIEVDRLIHIDHACVDLLSNWATQYAETGGTVTAEWDRIARKCHGHPADEQARPRPHVAPTTARAAAAAAAGGR